MTASTHTRAARWQSGPASMRAAGLSLVLSMLVPVGLGSAESGASVRLRLDDQANKLMFREYRKPFIVPERIA